MKTAEAAVIPGTGRTARSSLPEQSIFAKGRWYYSKRGDLASLPAEVRGALCAAVAGVGDLPVVPRRSDKLN